MAIDETATDETATDETATDETATDETAKDDTGADETAGDDPAADESAADQSASDQTATDETATDETATDETAPDQRASDESAGDESASDGTGQDPAASDTGGADVGIDPGPPYLFVDQYPGDSGARPPWETLVATPNFHGVILKAWEGVQYADRGWFAANWPAVRDVGGERYGRDWFRGAYLFLRFDHSGADQADAYLRAVDAAGGWDHGDILPVIDVEQGDPKNPNNFNAKASAEQVVECATQAAERLKSELGRRVMLYGRGAMRELGITDHMGCDVVWNPAYTAHMVTNGLQSWDLEDIALWQYCGDNTAFLAGYPHQVPGFGKIDISVYVKGSQKPTLQLLRDSLL